MSVLGGDLQTLSYEATLYLYPLALMDVTRLQALNTPPEHSPMGGPHNEFHHLRAFPTADFRAVVRPNFDTLYSSAWLDLTSGPVIVHAPDTDDRYYMLPMLDMWTDVFANPGKRTTGTAAQDFVVIGPGGRTDDVPPGLPMITAPTPYVWIIGRTQTNGPSDYQNVHKIQDGYGITVIGDRAEHAVDAAADISTEPLRVVSSMGALKFFTYAAGLLAVNPPHSTDFSILARISRMGISAEKPFAAENFDTSERAEIEAGWEKALQHMSGGLGALGKNVNGWVLLTDTIGVYGNAYFRRAAVALGGLGANPPEDAIYPVLTADADGDPVVGERNYVLHFDADELPPVAAFWSVTMYDAEGYQVTNEIDRFAIGDRDRLTFNGDGSLDLYLQQANPGPDRVSNWLPTPSGPLGITMRLYAPARAVIDGTWYPPPVRKA